MYEDAIRRYAALSVPRYTSYPTAADFSDTISTDDHGRWLWQLAPGEQVSLYLHVPYCRQICHYCGCHAKMAIRDEVIAGFVDALLAEIDLVRRSLSSRPQVIHLHWGGGTPSILSARQFSQVMAALRATFDFDPHLEHAIELDPRTVTPALAEMLVLHGVNRASLGIQDIDPSVQRAIGRVQPLETVTTAVEALRGAGINRINFDLIYGLPLQTVETLAATCATVATLAPDRIACYGYAHLPQRRANQRLIDVSALPDADERFAQSRVIADCFAQLGYDAIGMDHFALPDDRLAICARQGNLNRNFQGYTDDSCQTLIGFGPSSISQFRDGFAQTIADIGQYKRKLLDNRLATVRGHAFRDQDRLRSAIIVALMCNFRADLKTIAPEMDFSDELALLRPMVADDLVTVNDGIVAATERGKPLIRLVAAAFDEFRKENVHGFSFAV